MTDSTTVDGILLILRVLSGLILLGFVGALTGLLWRDYRATALELESRGRRRGRLIVVKAEGLPIKVGAAFPLLPLTTIGRAPTNTLPLNDVTISTEHALITLRGGQWWLEDRGSSNGTLLNSYRLEEPTVISAGDVVGIGRIALKIELD